MKKDFYYIELYEIYKGLLTDKQQDMFYSHYLLDLSYAEIAETSTEPLKERLRRCWRAEKI